MHGKALGLAVAVSTIWLGSVGGASALGNHPEWCDEQSSKNAAERTICSTKSLWVLDDNLNLSYAEALKHIGGQRSQLVSSQVNWIKTTRNGCGANVGCLTHAYNTRIAALDDIARRRHM